MSFIVIITTKEECKNIPVTADSAIDAFLSVVDRLPLDAKVKVFPV